MQKLYSKLPEIIFGGLEIDIQQLEEWCELPEDNHLGNLVRLDEILNRYNLEVTPPLTTGNFEDRRNITAKIQKYNLEKMIESGEGHTQEFKSTAFCNTKKFQDNPNLNSKAYDDPDILNSTLKTIAAFSNSDGGVLLIGITDEGEIFGIEKDFLAIDVQDIDKWELKLRSKINNLFLNGKCMNSFVKIDYVKVEDKTVAIIKVTKREPLDFLKYKETYRLYIRQGNQTVQIDYHEIESFFTIKKK